MKLLNVILKITVLLALFTLCFLFIYDSFHIDRKQLQVCPVNAISLQNGKAVINASRCIGCGRCVFGIPNPNKISLVTSDKKTENQLTIHSLSVPDTLSDKLKTANKVSSANTEKKKPSSQNVNITTTKNQAVKKIAYLVNSEKCIGCELCISRCPVNAISFIKGKAVIDVEKCIGDGICVNGNGNDFSGCPVGAISKEGE